MFHLTTLFVAALTFVSCGVRAQTSTTLSYDTTYDNGNLSLNDVTCSNGPNGLETKYPNDTTLSQLPGYPNVGGVETVTGWNSPNCGACYAVTYGSNTVKIMAVDKSTTGFTVSEAAMNTLTGGQAVAFGRVDVTYVPVSC